MANDFKDDYLPVNQLKQYELLRQIARGPRSAVYMARDTSTKRFVAIKLLNRDVSADPQTVWMFVSQASAGSRLQHNFIAQTYFIGRDEGFYFCAREFVDGDSLGSRLAEGQNFSTDELLEASCHILEAVAAAHARGIEHGNLHSENVLFDRVQERLVLTDFQGSEAMATVAATEGTADKTVNFRRDLRSVGSLVQQMLLGFDATSAFSARSKSITSADLTKFIERLMGKGVAPPFQSAAEALLTAKRLAGDEPPLSMAEMGAADNLLKHQVSAAATIATAVVELPEVEAIPDLPDDLLAAAPASQSRSWWQWLGGKKDSDGVINRLKEAYAKIETALADMHRRQHWLTRWAEEERSILESLKRLPTAKGTSSLPLIDRQENQLATIARRKKELDEAIQRLQSQQETLAPHANAASGSE